MTSTPIDPSGAAIVGERPPFVGALLRLCWQKVRARVDAAVRDAGFTDLQETHMLVFSYPPPDGVRPSDLAQRIRMSRQATNHVIAQLEALGYLERRAGPDSTRRLVYLTDRGWAVGTAIFTSLRDIHAEWSAELGAERFATFLSVLRQMAQPAIPPDGKLP